MARFTASFYNPAYNYTAGASGYSANVPIESIDMEDDFDNVSVAYFSIRQDVVDIYSDETADTTNAVQLNSTVNITDTVTGVIWFRGYVVKKPTVVDHAGGNRIEVEAWGKDGVLMNALVPDASGNPIWVLESDDQVINNMPLVSCSVYGTFQGSTLWPDPFDPNGAKAYIGDGSANADALDVAIGDGTYAITGVNVGTKTFTVVENVAAEFVAGDTFYCDGTTGNDDVDFTVVSATWTGAQTDIVTAEAIPDATVDGDIKQPNIILSTTNQGFVPRGFVKIETEWIYFDGYDDAAPDLSGKYRLRNVIRGQLTSVAVIHAATTVVYEKLAKQISPSIIRLQNDPGTGYVTLRIGREYDVMVNLGAFVLPEVAAGTYRCTYGMYDEDNSWGGHTAITMDDVVEAIVTAPKAYGGAGFAAGDCNFGASSIKINRYEYDPAKKPVYAWDAIHDLIESVSLEKQVAFWFRHHDDEFRLSLLANSVSSFTVPFVNGIRRNNSIDDVYSLFRIEYTDDQNLNRCSKTYSWHQAATDAAASPLRYRAVSGGGESWGGTVAADYVAANNDGMEYTCDGKGGTKLGGEFSAGLPNGDFEFGHYWFGSGTTPPSISLDSIELSVGPYRRIDATQAWRNDDDTWVVHLEGCNDYNSTTNAGTWVALGCEMEGFPDKNGKFVTGKFTNFIIKQVNAVRVIFDYMPGPVDAGGGIVHWGYVHDIRITGDETKYVTVQLTDSVSDIGDISKVYAPETFEKLRGGVLAAGSAGCQRSKQWPVGATSDGAALSLGRTALKVSLARFDIREYEYKGYFPSKPHLGLTVVIDEDGVGGADYEGVIHSWRLRIDHNGIIATASVLDHNASVLT